MLDHQRYCDRQVSNSSHTSPRLSWLMRPCRYNPALKGSLYERRAQSVSRQLCGEDMRMDYDQLLAKPPNKPDAVFHWSARGPLWCTLGAPPLSQPGRVPIPCVRSALLPCSGDARLEPRVAGGACGAGGVGGLCGRRGVRVRCRHQDLAYWPVTPDTRTASFWLAIDDATVANGCLQFVPGTHREDKLRHHGPLHGDRDKSHTLVATLQPSDVPKVCPKVSSTGTWGKSRACCHPAAL